MPVLHVEIEDFVEAAEIMSERVAAPTRTTLTRLAGVLSETGAMAGDDPGGQDWARVYDQAALATVQATDQIVLAADHTCAMFGRSAHNYAEAERASTTTGGPPASTGRLLARIPAVVEIGPVVRASPPPSAAGGSGDPPFLWSLIKDAVGYVWPNGHQDRLRAAAHAWRRSSATLGMLVAEPIIAAGNFSADGLPEAADITTVCQGLSNHLSDLVDAHLALATACEDLAQHIDECHAAVEDELVDLVVESAAIQIIGGLISIFTAGAAEGPTQGVQGAKIAQVAAVVGRLIDKFIEAARTVAAAVRGVSAVAERIRETMEALATTRLATAGVASVPALTRTGRVASTGAKLSKGATAEIRAAERLGDRGLCLAKRGRIPALLRGRAAGSGGAWRNAETLEDHFRRHGTDFGALTKEQYASKASDFLQRAYREGLPMRVTKRGDIRVWDPATRTFGSYSADGATRTFYVADRANYFDTQPGVLR